MTTRKSVEKLGDDLDARARAEREKEGPPVDTIPEEVIDALEAARDTSEVNMLGRQSVMKLISDLDEYPAAVLWLYENDRRYMEALIAMGERLAAERGA